MTSKIIKKYRESVDTVPAKYVVQRHVKMIIVVINDVKKLLPYASHNKKIKTPDNDIINEFTSKKPNYSKGITL